MVEVLCLFWVELTAHYKNGGYYQVSLPICKQCQISLRLLDQKTVESVWVIIYIIITDITQKINLLCQRHCVLYHYTSRDLD